MPDAKDNAKLTGDTHPPEVESDMPEQDGMSDGIGADGTPRDRGQGAAGGEEGRAGRGINQAGFLKDKDARSSDSGGSAREPGERPK